MDEGCDIVGCTRYSYGGRVYGGSFIERILSRMANKIFYSFGSRTFTDSTNGIKMLRISKFKNMEFKAKVGWSIGFELAIISQRENMRLGEVPMISINRFYGGKSSFSVGPWIIEYLKFFFRGFKEVRKSGNRKVMRI